MTISEVEVAATERRIEGIIAVLGGAITLGAGLKWGLRGALGAGVGTALCLLNFRWLRQGATEVIRLGLAQEGAEQVDVPRRLHAKFFGRLILLPLVVYAILAWLRLPVASVICGLAAVVPAIMIELAYELIRGHHHWNAQ